MGILGTQEIVILVIMLAIIFGAKKIPELARNAGRAKGEFQRGLQEVCQLLEKIWIVVE